MNAQTAPSAHTSIRQDSQLTGILPPLNLDQIRQQNAKAGSSGTSNATPDLGSERINNLLRSEISWTRESFYPLLIDSLKKAGFDTTEIEAHKTDIQARLEKVLAGVHPASLGNAIGMHVGDNISIGIEKINEQAARIRAANPNITDTELDKLLSGYIRDTLVHEVIHGLQPNIKFNDPLPQLELIEGGAELLSNLILSEARTTGAKSTYLDMLPVLCNTIFPSQDNETQRNLRQDFLRFSILGYTDPRAGTGPESQMSPTFQAMETRLNNAIEESKRPYGCRINSSGRLLGYNFENGSFVTPIMSPMALQLFTQATYPANRSLEEQRHYLRPEYDRLYQKRQQTIARQ